MKTSVNKCEINIDVFLGIFLSIFSLVFLHESSKIHPEAARFPKLILSISLIFSIFLTIYGMRKTLNTKLKLKSDTLLNFEVIQMPLAVFVIIAVYILLIKHIGFFVSTILFVPALMVFYGVRNIHLILLTDVLLNLFVYVFFVKILNVIFP
ncbi:MAG: tripartite tricarboxylate transporter TctB family protein [Thermoanaerobacteraceae bacterium]|nr:tripartite tricarboxylate transporter TctB family protein [Thermoanaerobacteraceae bacterium]